MKNPLTFVQSHISPKAFLQGMGGVALLYALLLGFIIIQKDATLHRMESRGWLKGEWSVSPKGRRAKYYVLSESGRRRLDHEQEEWSRYVEAVSKVFNGPVPEGAK